MVAVYVTKANQIEILVVKLSTGRLNFRFEKWSFYLNGINVIIGLNNELFRPAKAANPGKC